MYNWVSDRYEKFREIFCHFLFTFFNYKLIIKKFVTQFLGYFCPFQFLFPVIFPGIKLCWINLTIIFDRVLIVAITVTGWFDKLHFRQEEQTIHWIRWGTSHKSVTQFKVSKWGDRTKSKSYIPRVSLLLFRQLSTRLGTSESSCLYSSRKIRHPLPPELSDGYHTNTFVGLDINLFRSPQRTSSLARLLIRHLSRNPWIFAK